VKAIEKGVSEDDLKQMHELDRMFGSEHRMQDDQDDEEMGSAEEEYIRRRMEERRA
jgi:hypothetical protein